MVVVDRSARPGKFAKAAAVQLPVSQVCLCVVVPVSIHKATTKTAVLVGLVVNLAKSVPTGVVCFHANQDCLTVLVPVWI